MICNIKKSTDSNNFIKKQVNLFDNHVYSPILTMLEIGHVNISDFTFCLVDILVNTILTLSLLNVVVVRGLIFNSLDISGVSVNVFLSIS